MAKLKNKVKKRKLSETVKKEPKKKTLNPFEIHVNRQKHNVLGRKLKADRGLPGVSRSKAMKKRKATLLQEYKVKDKTNKFLDHRIGEKNRAMTAEDRIIARFTAVRMKNHSKKSIFNLDEDEVLTHHGQALSEIEKFDDPRSEDEDESERGKLEADFVGEAHFGGGMLKKADGEGKKSHKDLIDQLIAESKKRKAEKQKTREQTIELTEKLDSEWKDLLPIVSTSKKKPAENEDVIKPDSYDIAMKQLKFEARGKASDPLKSEADIAKQERERLEKLEVERQERMCGFVDESQLPGKHRSADDLDDGFEIGSEPEVFVMYDEEGKLILQGIQDGEEADEDTQKVVSTNEAPEGAGEDGEQEEESDTDESNEEGSDHEDEDNYSDLKIESDNETDSSDANIEPESKKSSVAPVIQENQETTRPSPTVVLDDKMKKKLIEEATKLFPNISQVPDSYEELQAVLSHYNAVQQGVIIEHMITNNHPHLNENNKAKLDTLFVYLLQHLNDAPLPTTKLDGVCHCFGVLNHIAPHLYDLAQMSPKNACHSVQEVLKEKQLEFRKHNHTYPQLDTLVFLKVTSLLFPTSDFRHPVVTPALVFICQMLMQCRVKTKRDVATGLLLVALMLEFTVLSKRFSPAAINFLQGVLQVALPDTSSNRLPLFKSAKLLVPNNSLEEETLGPMMLLDVMNEVVIDDSFRLRALSTAVSMLGEFRSNLESLSASYEVFKSVSVLLSELQVIDRYPQCLRDEIMKLKNAIEKMNQKKRKLLVVEKKQAKVLRLYEPHIEKVYDCKRRRPMGKEKQEHEKLLHKYKREQKAALREIRRDNAFIAKLKWKETLKNDMERNRKVKEIYGSAAIQQGELHRLKRKKK